MHESWDNGAHVVLLELLDCTNLTDWECEFVDSVDKQMRGGSPLSTKQRDKMFDIYQKRVA